MRQNNIEDLTDGYGLNIVFDEPSPPQGEDNFGAKPRKKQRAFDKKKKNRLKRNKKNNEVKSMQEQNSPEYNVENNVTQRNVDSTIEAGARENRNGHPSLQDEDSDTKNVLVNDKFNHTEGGPKPETQEKLGASCHREPSRRYHDKDSLQTEEERGKYMAEFHAHPLEMDRRNCAVSSIIPSSSSTHIFLGARYPKTDDTKENSFLNCELSQCPFMKLGLNLRLSNAIKTKSWSNITRPTIIQAKALAALLPSSASKNELTQSNVFLQSETGSGKTLAYLLPILQSLVQSSKVDSNSNLQKTQRASQKLRAIIVLPTRELASQIYKVTLNVVLHSYSSQISTVSLCGGEKRKSEKARLRKGVSIIISTPGRILDHLQKTECLRLSIKKYGNDLGWFVLDEADRMLDMGLGGQVKQILNVIRCLSPSSVSPSSSTRLMLVSATVTTDMKDIANSLMMKENLDQPWVFISANEIQSEELERNKTCEDNEQGFTHISDSEQKSNLPSSHAAPKQLAQQIVVANAKIRLPTLVAFLLARVVQRQNVVVFMSTCDGVDFYYELFSSVKNFLLEEKSCTEESEEEGIFGNSCKFYRLHGKVPHSERSGTIKEFASFTSSPRDKSHILIATDVAARGLDLPGVKWIVQYDPPCEISDYIHRIGRTARAGDSGNALMFLLPSEKPFVDILRLKGANNLMAANATLSVSSTLEKALNLCPRKDLLNRSLAGSLKSDATNRPGEALASLIQTKLEEHVINHSSIQKKRKSKYRQRENVNDCDQSYTLLQLGCRAYSSFISSYPTKEKLVRHIFCARALHLGHIARSFALKDPPKVLVRSKMKKKRLPADKSGTLGFNNSEYHGDECRSKKKSRKSNDFNMSSPTGRVEAKARMLSVAQKMQIGGNEFF